LRIDSHARLQAKKTDDVSRVQRQVENLFICEPDAELRVFRVHDFRGRRHFDNVGNRADLERQVQRDSHLDGKRDVAGHLRLESRQFGFHVIRAGRQLRHRVDSQVVGDHGSRHAGRCIRDCNLNAGDYRIRRIHDPSCYGSETLPLNYSRRQQYQSDQQSCSFKNIELPVH
jgi:hypothetical protein